MPAHDAPMSTSSHRVVHGPHWAVIGWLVAVGCLATGVALLAAGGALAQERLALDRLVLCLSAATVGAIVLVRRPGHGIGRICLAAGILAGAGILGAGLTLAGTRGYVTQLVPAIGLLTAVVAPIVAYVLIGPILLGAYPSGHFGPVGRRLVPIAAIVLAPLGLVALITTPTLDYGGNSTFNPIGVPYPPQWVSPMGILALGLTYLGGLALACVGLVMRYRDAASTERLQIRLVTANAIAVVALPIALFVALSVVGYQIDEGGGAYLSTALLLVAAFVPVCVGVAILRYRLYDIDRILSNALGYGLVTVVLFSVFAVVNLALVSRVSPLVNNEGIAVAASTLLVAALFNPLRTRVQRGVDRRFHRARYDADRMLADLSGRLRDEVEIARLRLDILDTVDRSVEPTGVWLWLRPGTTR